LRTYTKKIYAEKHGESKGPAYPRFTYTQTFLPFYRATKWTTIE